MNWRAAGVTFLTFLFIISLVAITTGAVMAIHTISKTYGDGVGVVISVVVLAAFIAIITGVAAHE